MNKNYVNDTIRDGTLVRFNATLENNLKIALADSDFNLKKHNTEKNIDTSFKINPNSGGFLLQQWNKSCNDEENKRKLTNLIRSTRRTSPSPDSKASSLSPFGDRYMF